LLKDVILHNRGTSTIAGGNVTTDGKQAAVMGIYESEITQGFSVVKGTSLKFGDTVLMSATAPVTVAVDYRAVKKQIQNTEAYVEAYPEEEDIDRSIPTTYVNTNAAAACSVTLNVGKDAPYTVSIDGETVTSTYNDGFLTINVPAGSHDLVIVGTHTCVFDQKVETVAHMHAAVSCETAATYYYSCICGENGKETFQVGEARGHMWNPTGKVETPPTCDKEGTMIYRCRKCTTAKREPIPTTSHQMVKQGMFWVCTVCGGSYANEAATMTADKLITIIAIAGGAVLLIAAGVVVLLIVMKKRKRANKAEQEPQNTEEPQVNNEQTE
jgi:hypothetical protein